MTEPDPIIHVPLPLNVARAFARADIPSGVGERISPGDLQAVRDVRWRTETALAMSGAGMGGA